jgi:hypothetical protein
MLKFVAAGLLEGALEYVRRAYEIVLSVRIFQYNNGNILYNFMK